jgi:hypothetical protein
MGIFVIAPRIRLLEPLTLSEFNEILVELRTRPCFSQAWKFTAFAYTENSPSGIEITEWPGKVSPDARKIFYFPDEGEKHEWYWQAIDAAHILNATSERQYANLEATSDAPEWTEEEIDAFAHVLQNHKFHVTFAPSRPCSPASPSSSLTTMAS